MTSSTGARDANDHSALSQAGGGRWEHFNPDADIGVCGHGASLAQVFEQAALALNDEQS